MKPSDVFFTPKDLWRTIKGLRLRHAIGLVVGVAVAVGVTKLAGKEAGFFAGLLVFFIIARAAAAVSFTMAVITFILIIIATPLQGTVDPGDTSITERLAVWAFYLLVIGVVLLVIDSIWPVDKPAADAPRFVHPVFGKLATAEANGKFKAPKAGKIKHRSFRLTKPSDIRHNNYLDRMHDEHLKEVALAAKQEASAEKAQTLAGQLKLTAAQPKPSKPNVPAAKPTRAPLPVRAAKTVRPRLPVPHAKPAPVLPHLQPLPFRKARPITMDIVPKGPPPPKPRHDAYKTSTNKKSPRPKKNLIGW